VTDLQNNLLLRSSSYKSLRVVKVPHAKKEVEGQKGMTATAATVSAEVPSGLSRLCRNTPNLFADFQGRSFECDCLQQDFTSSQPFQ
jgi:hypothetical protein